MFENCKELKSLDLNHFDMSWNKDMSYMFSGCDNLEELKISSFDTSLVRDMSHLFDHCSSLENLDISSFDTSVMTRMDYMLSYIGVKNLDLRKLDTSNVKTFEGVFEGCEGLNITINQKKCKNLIPIIPEYVHYDLIEDYF